MLHFELAADKEKPKNILKMKSERYYLQFLYQFLLLYINKSMVFYVKRENHFFFFFVSSI